ncbi:MAG TPA: glucokinase, partial [Polyangiaceae bacterium]|nr:glucokinase [Polyangiaceae bacterium]
MLLAGDIGGTHARLSLIGPSGRAVRKEEFSSAMYGSLEDVVKEFLGSIAPTPKVTGAAFGVAGPVVNGRVIATNLAWTIDAKVIARKLAIKNVVLLNDLVALSLGSLRVAPSKLHALGDNGVPKKRGANIAVIAAGTGLGEAMLVWDGQGFVPAATEGGHADFAARDDLEVELLQFLRARFGRVSWERILSGNGLGNLYDFFRQAKGMSESAEQVEQIAAAPDRNAAIANLASAGKSEPASRAMQLFGTIYGAEAGNLALKTLALGGVYVCGNIAARMLPVFESGVFRKAFRDKGRMGAVMEKIPVAVVLDKDVGLAGATSAALTLPKSVAKRAPKRSK